MNCESVLVLIYDFIDGEILPDNDVLLKKHLENCQNCQKILKSIEVAEKFYQNQIMVNPAPIVSNTITKKVLQNKNIFSFQTKSSYWSTKKIIYYVGAMAASFAAFIYLTGSLIIFNLASKIDFLSFFSNTPNSNLHPNMSFGQVIEAKSKVLVLLETINFASQSTLLKDLEIILFLISLQVTISYLFTRNKVTQDKKL